MPTIKIEVQEGKAAARVSGSIRRLVRLVADFTLRTMGELAPVRKGRLKRSIRQQRISDYEVAIGPTVPYAVYVDQGTRPHVIRPVRAQALRFEVAGEIVFSKLVHHPGTKPTYFVRHTAEAARRRVIELWHRSWQLGG